MVITGNHLKHRGWLQGRLLGVAKRAAQALLQQGMERDLVLDRLDDVQATPERYIDDPILGRLAEQLLAQRKQAAVPVTPPLHGNPLPYSVWGEDGIEDGARAQMDAAMRLPVTIAGALMPDAHQGYGLPIGGVLATDDCVIPYAVGVDIACRMRLSVYPETPEILAQTAQRLKKALVDHTFFGAGQRNPHMPEHQVLDDPAWDATPFLRSLQPVAARQLGTSGTGNHFVEWGTLTILEYDSALDLQPGEYLALLSHSGSRGVGFKIANAYSQQAMDMHPTLDKSVRHLAWLPLSGEAGVEYWLSMELAGRFASANHAIIHRAVAKAAGLDEIAAVENHHNFSWRESVTTADGSVRDAIVHRKGATPAGPGVLGVIPGSMADPGFVVRGRGDVSSLASASHGAGRRMSRKAAINSIPKAERDRYLQERGVTLLGGGIDESPQAYKRIEDVVASQHDLFDIIGKFTPRIVRMASEAGDI